MGLERDRLLWKNFEYAEGRYLSFEGGEPEQWRSTNLPHDFNIGQKWNQYGKGGSPQGFVECYHDLTYRHRFSYEPQEGCRALLLFDGVYRDCTVWVNGQEAGGHRYGYTPFSLDVTQLVKEGENLLEVYVDNRTPPSCRWYSGMGIYRDLHLLTLSELHTKVWGTRVTTPEIGEKGALIRVQATLENQSGRARSVELTHRVLKEGREVLAFAPQSLTLQPGDTPTDCSALLFPYDRWDLDSPNLYELETVITEDGQERDRYRSVFGVRSMEFIPEKGAFLNGRPIKLCGIDLHHDSGCLGSAFVGDVWEKRLKDWKALGCNAIRTSHNPQASLFYDLCDRLGILVFDEVFDKWNIKEDYNYYPLIFDQCWEQDLSAMLRRDCNHPSVIIWSVGNEVDGQGGDFMCQTLKMLADYVKAFDPTRPVTFAMEPHSRNGMWDHCPEEVAEHTAKMMEHVDLICGNYSEQWYEAYHKRMPEKLIIGTEIFQYYSGYRSDPRKMRDYHPLNFVRDSDYVIGSFLWAGSDYLGESFCWPARGWSGAIVDLAGFPKPLAGLFEAYWKSEPVVRAAVWDDRQPFDYAPTWWSAPPCVNHLNIRRHPGQNFRLGVFTNCDAVEVFYDGVSFGEQRLADQVNRIIPYNLFFGGKEVVVVGKNDGKEVCREVLSTHGAAAAFTVTPSKTALEEGPHQAAMLEIRLQDREGRPVYAEERQVSFALEEGLVLMGLENGDIASHHDYTGSSILTHHGHALAVIGRSNSNGPRRVKVTVDGVLEEQYITIS